MKPLNLPPIGTEVLVICENPHTHKTTYAVATRSEPFEAEARTPDGNIVSVTSYFVEDPDERGVYVWDVTHWMPLPETYSDNVEPIRK